MFAKKNLNRGLIPHPLPLNNVQKNCAIGKGWLRLWLGVKQDVAQVWLVGRRLVCNMGSRRLESDSVQLQCALSLTMAHIILVKGATAFESITQ